MKYTSLFICSFICLHNIFAQEDSGQLSYQTHPLTVTCSGEKHEISFRLYFEKLDNDQTNGAREYNVYLSVNPSYELLYTNWLIFKYKRAIAPDERMGDWETVHVTWYDSLENIGKKIPLGSCWNAKLEMHPVLYCDDEQPDSKRLALEYAGISPQPKKKNNDKGEYDEPVLLVVADKDCVFKIDLEEKGILKAGEGQKIPVSIGEHLLEARPLEGGENWTQVLNILKGGQRILKIEFKEGLMRSAFVPREIQTSSFTDSRDNKEYRTVQIGNQEWMAENLNFETFDSWCQDNLDFNCKRFGHLYTWDAAQIACPVGWHLPTQNEWNTLLDYVGGEGYSAYQKMIKGGGSGFDALFVGWVYFDGSSYSIGDASNFWSSTDLDAERAWYCSIGKFGKEAFLYEYVKTWGFSVRCLKD